MTVQEHGWSGYSNGKLLKAAGTKFDVFLTMDRGLEHQQNLENIDLGIILLSAVSNDYDDLFPLIPEINRTLKRIKSGMVIKVEE